MKIIVSFLKTNENETAGVTANQVKKKLVEMGFNPISVRKRKIRHVFYHWFVELDYPILGTSSDSNQPIEINFIDIYDNHPHIGNNIFFKKISKRGSVWNEGSVWYDDLTPIRRVK